jgi:hypothetical protein
MPFGLAMAVYVAFFDTDSKKIWNPKSNAAIFLFLLTVISYYFSSKMIRLVLMLCVPERPAPSIVGLRLSRSSIGAACAGGVAVSEILSWAVEKLTRCCSKQR